MIFREMLEKYIPKAIDTVWELFQKAEINQANENDIFLVMQNGYYEEAIAIGRKQGFNNLSPYVIGAGESRMKEATAMKLFFENYVQKNTINGNRKKYYEWSKSKERISWERKYNLRVQDDLTFYLKFWESEFVLILLRQLVLLSRGYKYNWHLEIPTHSRGKFIEDKIIALLKGRAPKMYNYLSLVYERDLRNSIAHSQYFNLGETFTFTGYPNGSKLKMKSPMRMDVITGKLVALYIALNHCLDEMNKRYTELYEEKHFGVPIQVPRSWDKTELRTEYYKWVDNRWMWYSTWDKHYRKWNFTIG